MAHNVDDLRRSLEVLREMLTDRGTEARAVDRLGESLRMDDAALQRLAGGTARPYFVLPLTPLLRVAYVAAPKVKLQDVRGLLKEMEQQDGDQDGEGPSVVILVARDRPNASDAKRLAELGSAAQPRAVEFQLFTLKELQFNISRHTLVPRHELVSDPAEIEALVELHQVKAKSQFPHILRTDPMARYLNARPGQLMRVTRVSPSSGTYVVYRVVV